MILKRFHCRQSKGFESHIPSGNERQSFILKKSVSDAALKRFNYNIKQQNILLNVGEIDNWPLL